MTVHVPTGVDGILERQRLREIIPVTWNLQVKLVSKQPCRKFVVTVSLTDGSLSP